MLAFRTSQVSGARQHSRALTVQQNGASSFHPPLRSNCTVSSSPVEVQRRHRPAWQRPCCRPPAGAGAAPAARTHEGRRNAPWLLHSPSVSTTATTD